MVVEMSAGPTARARKRKKRKDSKYALQIRALVAERDGYCCVRTAGAEFLVGECKGESQWAHFGEFKRYKTRCMKPEERHCTHGALMLCAKHHDALDRYRMSATPLTDKGCDGTIEFASMDRSYDDRIADAPLVTCSSCSTDYRVQTRAPIPQPYICGRCQ